MPAAAAPTDERPRNADGTFKPTTTAPAIDANAKPANEKVKLDGKDAEKPKLVAATPAVLEFMGDFTAADREKQKKKEAKPEGEQPAAKETKPAAKPEDKKKEAAPATKTTAAKPAAPAPQMTAADITKAAAEGFKQTLAEEKTAKKEKEVVVDPDADLPAPEKEKLAVLRHMEKLIPERKGVADQYRSNLKKLSDYANKWEKDHPGETFDEDAEEHTDFFEKNGLYQLWDDDEYIKAMADKISEDKMQRAKTETESESNKRLNALERENKVLKAQPVIATHKNVAARNYFKNIGGEFDGLVLENGTLDPAKEKALAASDPDLYNATIGSAIRLDNLVEQAYLLKKGLIDFAAQPPSEQLKATDRKAYDAEMAKFNDHQYLAGFALDQEKIMLAKPLEGQVNNAGQQFKPAAEYYKLPLADRERHWTFNEADLAALLAWDEGKKMKAFITAEEERFNRKAAARGMAPKESVLAGKPDDKEKPPVEEEEPAKPNVESEEDNGSPTSTASPKSATILQTGKKDQKDALTAFVSF